jgi:CobQ-like glutamine amidotransferase family enzyme
MQGITAFNHPKRGDPGFDRIVFANNKVTGTYPHGVAIYDARDSEITGNIVRTEPGSKYKASINVINCERCKQAGNDIGPKR